MKMLTSLLMALCMSTASADDITREKRITLIGPDGTVISQHNEDHVAFSEALNWSRENGGAQVIMEGKTLRIVADVPEPAPEPDPEPEPEPEPMPEPGINFLENARQQAKGNWRAEYTAQSAIQYLMAGWDMTPAPYESDGWTQFQQSADTNVIYISNSEGNDSNPCTQAKPCKTPDKGYQELRDGFPDWLLFRRGDTWTNVDFVDGRWQKSGRSLHQPMLISAYGNGSRPKFFTDGGVLNVIGGNTVSNLAFVGLHWEPYKRQEGNFQYGVRWLNPGENLLFEDMFIGGYGINLDWFTKDTPGFFSNVRIRRNIIVDAWSTSHHAQGIFAKGVDGMLIEENVLDHNGWREGDSRSKFNHNIYLKPQTTNVVMRGNIISRGSLTGAQARGGGEIENNLFTQNHIGINWGGAGDVQPNCGNIRDNVFIDGNRMGVEVSNAGSQCETRIENNLIARYSDEFAHGIKLRGDRTQIGLNNVVLRDNVIYEVFKGLRAYVGNVNGVTIADNIWQKPVAGGKPLMHMHSSAPYSLTGNTYYRVGDSDWFQDDGVRMDIDQWRATIEPDATAEQVQFTDPDRSLD